MGKAGVTRKDVCQTLLLQQLDRLVQSDNQRNGRREIGLILLELLALCLEVEVESLEL
ncbi:hypothetical protein MBAV_004223 [Candidatus Magnetobacterium bavaricum]|uniref:Uncharacterized protein n=1 Tax=Candidatus Magnetobacterium bavaricum TaxID=29290 RepID=A0A0F3GSB7_9BACT|nr:hypothetical protein MBAV_004223 [Candidatus Magnetobacterium bavaricum]